MSEETENLEEMNEIQTRNQRNVANNANAVRNAADMASRSANPYAKASGTAVKAADKISGGKSSVAIGKGINRANKIAPGGRMAQGGINKNVESGTADRINKATNKRKGLLNTIASGIGLGSGSAVSKGRDNSFFSRKEVEEQASDGGGVNFKATVKVMKIALIAFAPVMVVIVFCCLFVASSQIFLHSFSMGEADNVSNSDVESTIKDNGSDDLDTEIKDDKDEGTTVSYDYFIDDKTVKFRQSKLVKVNLEFNVDFSEKVEITRPNNEADIEDLYDFYPGIMDYSNGDNNKVVETFFLKLHYLYTHYQSKYNIHLDLPLLMATLSKQSSDMGIVFSSNIEGYGESEIALKADNERFDYGKEFNYISSSTNSMYDMEVLAQNMASVQVRESCKDVNGKETNYRILKDDEIGTSTLTCKEGETYSATEPTIKEDEEKYREFLKEFLEKKYFLDGENSVDNSNSNNNQAGNSGENNNVENNNSESNSEGKVACALTIIGDKYYKTVVPATDECNVPRFDTPKGLEPKFYQNVKNLIAYAKSQGCDATIGSAYRSYEDQKRLYQCYINKNCNNGNLAAKPGKSNHEYGIAADLRYKNKSKECLELYRTNASRFGLDYPLWDNKITPENWHIEPIHVIIGTP